MDACKPKQNYPASRSPLQKSQSCPDREASSQLYNPLHPSQYCLYVSPFRKKSRSAVYSSSRSNNGFFMAASESDCIDPSRAGLLFGFRRAENSSRVLIFYTVQGLLMKTLECIFSISASSFFFPLHISNVFTKRAHKK